MQAVKLNHKTIKQENISKNPTRPIRKKVTRKNANEMIHILHVNESKPHPMMLKSIHQNKRFLLFSFVTRRFHSQEAPRSKLNVYWINPKRKRQNAVQNSKKQQTVI